MKLHRAAIDILVLLGCSAQAAGAPGSIRLPAVAKAHVGVAPKVALAASRGHLAATSRDPSTSESIEKVVTLLTELKEGIEKDGTSEQAAFDKYACWCETFTQERAAAITEAKDQLQSFGTSILKLKGNLATYVAEIAKFLQDIEENEEAQEATTAVRQKESAAYAAETSELHQAISALEQALSVLGSATAGMSLEQAAAGTAWRKLLLDIAAAAGKLPAHGRPSQAQISALRAAAGHRYTPQSATIQGILKDMYATFASDLESKTTQEANAHRLFEDYMATKQSELLVLQESVSKKQAAKAEAEIMLSDATEGYADTEAQLKASVELFDSTKEACTGKADQWAERKQLRADELAGVKKALELLTSDEAQEAFSKAKADGVPESFVQLQAARGSEAEAQSRALAALRASARRARSLRLASVAADLMQGGRTAGVGHFDQVLAQIDKLVAELKEEDLEDQKNVDQCKKEYQETELQVSDLGWKIQKSEAHIEKVSKLVNEKGEESELVIGEIMDVQKEITDMNATREAENSAFVQQKADDKKAIELLQETVNYLVKFYHDHGMDMGTPTSLLQQENASSQPPDLTFSDKGSRQTQSKGVIAILTHLIEDLNGEMVSDVKGEGTAQLDYEKQVKSAMQLEKDLTVKKTNIEDTILQLKAEISEEETSKDENEKLQLNENDTMASIKPGCDWIIANQAERRRKRGIEADGLVSAKQYLAGFQPSGASTLAQTVAHASRPWAAPRGRFRRAAGAALQVAAVGGERRR